ncbi:MAG: thioredoxin [Eubacterium sp.]|jgi:thioredoxin 1
MSEVTITKSNFDQIKNSDKPVLIDFWAPWCMPYRMMSPVVAKLADEYEGKAVVGKINVDEEPELAAAFGVASIPTFAVIKEGKVVRTKIGAMPKFSLEAMLK